MKRKFTLPKGSDNALGTTRVVSVETCCSGQNAFSHLVCGLSEQCHYLLKMSRAPTGILPADGKHFLGVSQSVLFAPLALAEFGKAAMWISAVVPNASEKIPW